MNRFIIFIVFLSAIVISGYIVYREGTLPVNKSDKSAKIFIVKPGQSVGAISNNLAFEGLIRNRLVFYLIIKQQQADKSIQAGDFRLSPSMTVFEIVKELQHGTLDSWITIIEGLRKEEIAQIISSQFQIPEIEFVRQAKEGYLFPDTYLIPIKATSETIINILNKNFEKKYFPQKEKAKQLRLKDSDVVILASLVEREAKLSQDRPQVASIILKRLENDWPLQIDATVQYALGYQSDEKTWWKKNLTEDDLKIDSPYNTYKNTGLPPGPICNPGLASLEAVVNADINTPYWYYLSDKTGRIYYSKTIEEHQQYINQYINK
jgi:UPF0755 protein